MWVIFDVIYLNRSFCVMMFDAVATYMALHAGKLVGLVDDLMHP